MGRALAVSAGLEPRGRDGVALASSPVLLEKVNAPDAAGSCREISPVWNASAFRRSFPERWGSYLRETYRTAYAVEKAFGIDSKTARDWIGGKRDPSGSFVAAVVARDPSALAILTPSISPNAIRRSA